MSKKISLGAAIAFMAIVAALTFTLTMVLSMNDFTEMMVNVRDRESMYQKLAEISRTVRDNYYYSVNEDLLMDNVAATLILAPILIPIGIELGCNELHIGMLFCICLVVGFVTPPFGYNLFTAISISGLNFKQIVKGSLPFLLTEIALLFVFAYVPGIITWLPRLMGYSY